MDRKEQGKLLRAWRRYIGERRGKKITLMALAADVADLAEQGGHSRKSRRIPGSHASMTRWELGDVDQSLLGLDLIARVYALGGAMDLMRPPPNAPPPNSPPPHEPAEDEMVRAFREFLATRKQA